MRDVPRHGMQLPYSADIKGISASSLGKSIVTRVKVFTVFEMAGKVLFLRGKTAVAAEEAVVFCLRLGVC